MASASPASTIWAYRSAWVGCLTSTTRSPRGRGQWLQSNSFHTASGMTTSPKRLVRRPASPTLSNAVSGEVSETTIIVPLAPQRFEGPPPIPRPHSGSECALTEFRRKSAWGQASHLRRLPQGGFWATNKPMAKWSAADFGRGVLQEALAVSVPWIYHVRFVRRLQAVRQAAARKRSFLSNLLPGKRSQSVASLAALNKPY